MTMCSGNALVMSDGAGRTVWRKTGHHYESVGVVEIREDVPGLESVVDIDHLPAPPMPLCLFDEQRKELGRINTEYTRFHALVDWNADGLQEIGSAVPRSLFDGRGRRVCSLAVSAGESPILIKAMDLAGHGMPDLLLTTVRQGTYRVYLYRNPSAGFPSQRRPAGTGLNRTLY